MKFLKKVFDFYVFSNIHVALATYCLVEITLILHGDSNNKFPFFVFFATLLSYNFIRLYRRKEIKSWLYDWIGVNKRYLHILMITSFLLLVYLGLQLRTTTLLLLVPLGMLTLFYVIPFKNNRALRTLPYFKLVLISFCWAFITVLLPAIEEEIVLTKDIWFTFFQRLLFVAAITIPFDIRDIKYDDTSLKTLPQIFGEAKVKRVGVFFLMLFLGLNFFKTDTLEFLSIEFVIMLISLLLLVRSSEKQGKYYSAFFVESIPIIWFLLLYIK